MKAFLAPRGVVHWFLAGVREQSRHSQKDTVRLNWLGTQNSGVPSDLEGRADIAHTDRDATAGGCRKRQRGDGDSYKYHIPTGRAATGRQAPRWTTAYW